jgi:hypothetical protein
MATVCICLGSVYWIVVALGLGMKWERLLHWSGEALLVVGVLLAAKGISDVRREWTRRPGIQSSVAQAAKSVRDRAVAAGRDRWHRFVDGWPRVARWLGLHPQRPEVCTNGGFGLRPVGLQATAPVGTAKISEGSDLEQRFAQLEKRMAEAEADLGAFNRWRMKEVEERRAETAQERAERIAADQQANEKMADLAGGGLRLQAWAVVCLLVGTVVTAFF